MLLQALPEGVKQEMIATRHMDAANILFKVFKTFQPGGLAERKQMLSQLTTTAAAKTSQEAVNALRLWKRQSQRAAELHATMPDIVLQVRAISGIMDELLAKDAQAAFRVNAYRMQHGIDVAPTEQSMALFFELLMAEAEQMVTSEANQGEVEEEKQNGKGSKPSVKMMTVPGNKLRTCHFWGSKEGCKMGSQCRYGHDWTEVEDKQARCWNCSSSQHIKPDCPYRSRQDGQSRSSIGGSTGGEFGKGNEGKGDGKGKKGFKGKKGEGKFGGKQGQGKDKDDKEKKEDREDQPAVKELNVEKPETGDKGGSNNGTGPGANGQEGLMTEVTSLLRSLRMTVDSDPKVRVCQIKRLQTEEKSSVLLDGGATHCMRERRSKEEWTRAVPVKVQLASGEVELRQCEETTTLLSDHPVQSIIPVSKVTELGYTVRWDRGGCQIEHIGKGKLVIKMAQGCPTIDAEEGEKLLQEIEEMERKKARIRAILQCNVLAESEEEKEIAALQTRYPKVPMRILERIPGEKKWDAT